MFYGAMHDSAILTIGKKIGRKGKNKAQNTLAEDTAETYALLVMVWEMVSWAKSAPKFAVAVSAIGFVVSGIAGASLVSGLAGAIAAYLAVGLVVGGFRFAKRFA